MSLKVTYKERIFLDKYRCIDSERTINLHNTFWLGNLLYGYVDRFNVKCISGEDILYMEEI